MSVTMAWAGLLFGPLWVCKGGVTPGLQVKSLTLPNFRAQGTEGDRKHGA